MKKTTAPSKRKAAKRPPMAKPLRLGLFALMFLAVIMMGARVNDIIKQIAHGETPTAFAPLKAEETPKPEEKKTDATMAAGKPDDKKPDAAMAAKPDDKKMDAAKPDDKKPDDKPAASPAAPGPDAAKPDDKATAAAKPADATANSTSNPGAADDAAVDAPDLSESEITVLKHLSDRRKELDKKSGELDQRETLLNLTEQRVDKKITDLKQMQADIRKELGEADTEHKAKVTSMVKIYETMKAKDAARIFDTMDLPTLVEVASRMKEAKTAPVLAAMDSGKARELSSALMAKKNLPAAP